MENFSFLIVKENLPFAISLTIMLFISLIEFVTTIMGMGLSHILDNILHFHPETFDISHDIGHDISHDHDFDHDSDTLPIFTKFLGWIRYNHVPLLIVFISFLTFFSITGLIEQFIISKVINKLLPWYIAIWPALFITLPLVRTSSYLLGKFLIKDETTSVSANTFIGKNAIITIGIASKNNPAEAKLVDEFNQTHYVMVEPIDDVTFSSGTKVHIIEKKADHLFLVKQLNS